MTDELDDDKDIDAEIKEIMRGQEPDAAASGYEEPLDGDDEGVEGDGKTGGEEGGDETGGESDDE